MNNKITYWERCPFCGSSAILITEDINGYPGEKEFYMRCRSPHCGATVPGGHYTTLHNSEEEAIKKAVETWNYRYKFKEDDHELFNSYVAGVLDAARKAIVVKYQTER